MSGQERTPAQRDYDNAHQHYERAVTKTERFEGVAGMAGAAFHQTDELAASVAALTEEVRHRTEVSDRQGAMLIESAKRISALEAAAKTAEQDQLCTCGHSKNSHYWQGGHECNMCPCNRFVPVPPPSLSADEERQVAPKLDPVLVAIATCYRVASKYDADVEVLHALRVAWRSHSSDRITEANLLDASIRAYGKEGTR